MSDIQALGRSRSTGIQELQFGEIGLVGGGDIASDLETVAMVASVAALGATVAPVPGARLFAAGAATVALLSYAAAQIID